MLSGRDPSPPVNAAYAWLRWRATNNWAARLRDRSRSGHANSHRQPSGQGGAQNPSWRCSSLPAPTTAWSWIYPPSSWSDSQLKAVQQPWHDKNCPANGDCRLQDLAVEYGVSVTGMELAVEGHPLDDRTPMIVRDYSRCIGCGRCVQACNEIQVNSAIPAPYGRRQDRPQGWYPIVDYDRCTHCGQCLQACPVGALFEKKAYGQIDGNEAQKSAHHLSVLRGRLSAVAACQGGQDSQGDRGGRSGAQSWTAVCKRAVSDMTSFTIPGTSHSPADSRRENIP